MSQTPYSINIADVLGQWAHRMAPSPTATVKQLAGMANFFGLMTLGTGAKLGNVNYYQNLWSVYQARMEAFVPRFTDAQAQELATWQIQHPTATPEEEKAFSAQQEADLTEFVGQLAAWVDAYHTRWLQSPLAHQ